MTTLEPRNPPSLAIPITSLNSQKISVKFCLFVCGPHECAGLNSLLPGRLTLAILRPFQLSRYATAKVRPGSIPRVCRRYASISR
jgi:hypothetical protein